jgi:hypothetical protein
MVTGIEASEAAGAPKEELTASSRPMYREQALVLAVPRYHQHFPLNDGGAILAEGNNQMKKTSFILLLASLLSASLTRAGVIYDNSGAVSSGSDPLLALGPLYDSFTSDSSGNQLTDLALVLLNNGSATGGNLSIGLYSDSSTTPGVLLGTLGTLSENSLSGTAALYDIPLAGNPTLAPDTRYWIGITDSGTSAVWSWSLDVSGTGVGSEFLSNQNGTFPNSGNGPYQMTVTEGSVTATPEPASVLLIVGSAGLLGVFRLTGRKSKSGNAVN